MVNVHEVRFEYEKQSQVYVSYETLHCIMSKIKCEYILIFLQCRRAALAEELSMLRQVDEFVSKGLSPPRGKNGFAR